MNIYSSTAAAPTSSSDRRVSGLASGLDTDELVKNMTAATRAKLAKQGQAKQLAAWRVEAYRSVSTQLVELSRNYMSFTSPTNLLSGSFYSSYTAQAVGGASGCVTVQSAASGFAQNLSILGIKHLAADAAATAAPSFSGSLSSAAVIDEAAFAAAAGDLAGKSISFTYNGVAKQITFSPEDGITDLASFADCLSRKLGDAFGAGRIQVTQADGVLRLETTLPAGGADPSSVLRVTGGDADTLGLLGLPVDSSNQLNLNVPLSQVFPTAGLDTSITINGVKIPVDPDTDTVKTLMDRVNSDSAVGVKLSYSDTLGCFSLQAKQPGASGKIQIVPTGGDLTGLLFGNAPISAAGQDAELTVRMGDRDVTLTRGSNTVTVDGLTLKLDGTFGYDAAGNLNADPLQSIRFNLQPKTDVTVDAVKAFVNDLNAIISSVNTQATTKYNRDYPPLTDEQRAKMSESEIKIWENKAKEGLLFGDSLLVSLANDLRGSTLGISTPSGMTLRDFGITTSTNWRDNGKLVVDEAKLREALGKNPEELKSLLSAPVSPTEPGSGGLAARVKQVMDKYAATEGSAKGLLITKAGLPAAPVSMLQNTMQTQIDRINETMSVISAKLKAEETRYYRQFTSLEKFMTQMNSQSAWLAQQFQ